MNQSIDLYDYTQSVGQGMGINQMQGFGPLAQPLYGGCYIQTIPASRPMARELTISLAAGKISLDYGEEIRLLMAEPVAGMKLREAVQLLKEALCRQETHQ